MDSNDINYKKIHDEQTVCKINSVFYWINSGNTVYITGSFSNWNKLFLMNKEKSDLFYLNLINKIKYLTRISLKEFINLDLL